MRKAKTLRVLAYSVFKMNTSACGVMHIRGNKNSEKNHVNNTDFKL